VKPRIQVHVEPLAEPRWARIRNAVYERIATDADATGPVAARRSPPLREGASSTVHAPAWRVWTAAAAVVIAVTMASLAYRSVTARGGRLADPSRIATGDAASHVVLDGLTLDVAAESAVVVSGDATRGILVVLDRGSVTLDVEPRAARAGFVVQAGEVRVRVVGTRFGVSRWMDRASVEVERGIVEVDASGRTVQVHAGETWRSADSVGVVGAPSVSASVTAVAAMAPSPRTPVDATPPEHVEHARVRRHASEAPVGASRTTDKAAASAPDPAAARPMPPQQPSSQQLYETAAQLEVSDPPRAIALYRQVVARGDSWLADALFAQGRLEAERGAQAQARATLTEYLARFPRGSNADDARLLLDRTR
jgi:hypothetical protein